MIHPLVELFRCPDDLAVLRTAAHLSPEAGYFRLRDSIGYGRTAAGSTSPSADGSLVDVLSEVVQTQGQLRLPFDLAEVVANLRHERYPEARRAVDLVSRASLTRAGYYLLRPLLPVGCSWAWSVPPNGARADACWSGASSSPTPPGPAHAVSS